MLCLNGLNISLDKREPGSDLDFISHAHSDHTSAAKASKHVLASEQTIQLIGSAYETSVANAGETASARLLESGHMLGAKQLYMDCTETGRRTIYTGDFNMQKTKTAKAIDIVEADCLIMNATYPDPEVIFGDRCDVEADMQDWTSNALKKGIVLFSAYAMGKAQELVALFNEVGIRPVVSRKISTINKVYEKNGIALEYASAYDDHYNFEDALKGDFVGITERRDLDKLSAGLSTVHGKKVSTAVATGFAKVFRFNTDAQFPLSDHADFTQSIEYMEAVGAKEVLTYGQNCEKFAANIRARGYAARPFSFAV